MNKKFLLVISLVVVLCVFGILFYFSQSEKIKPIMMLGKNASEPKPGEIKNTEFIQFIPLKMQSSPKFVKSLNNANDIKIDFHYEGDYPGLGWSEPEFYTPEGSNEKFLSISKLKERKDQYAYGPEYHSIFNPEGSHWYGGTPIYLLNKDSKYSVSYIGLKINDRDLISELKVEFGIDYVAGFEALGKSGSSIFSSVFKTKPVYACGPGLYLRLVGDSDLTFIEESDGIAWYQLKKPINLYNLSLNYADQNCSTMPAYCQNLADDPSECNKYVSCFYNATIDDFSKGNLRMHVLYKPNNKEGFLKVQVVNLILNDLEGTHYQPMVGENFDHYYQAYLH